MKDKIKKLKNLKEQIEVEEDCITIVRKSIKNIEKEIEVLQNEKV